MTHQFCEFCGRHIGQIPFGGYSHSADRTALCGGKPVSPAITVTAAAGAAPDTNAEPRGVHSAAGGTR